MRQVTERQMEYLRLICSAENNNEVMSLRDLGYTLNVTMKSAMEAVHAMRKKGLLTPAKNGRHNIIRATHWGRYKAGYQVCPVYTKGS